MIKMSYKDLKYQVRKGMTIDALLRRYEIDSQEKLFSLIRNNFTANGEGIIRDILANQKRADRKRVIVTTAQKEEQTENPSFNEASFNEGTQEAEDEGAELSEEESLCSPCERLRILQDDEEYLSTECIKHENSAIEAYQERNTVDAQLTEIDNTLQEMLKTVREKQVLARELLLRRAELTQKMQFESAEANASKQMLKEIREEIEELKKIVVVVFSDSIEVENYNIPDFPKAQIEEMVHQYAFMDEAEEATIRELKIVARTVLLVKELESSKAKYELVFDSELIQKIYEILVNSGVGSQSTCLS